jgi:uncharacterized protein YdaU (DUF1376 family)
MSRPWMPFYIGDYLRDTANLTTVQHGAYLLLIMHYWEHGNLPHNERELAAIARMPPKQWRAICDPIAKLFKGNWTHKRIDEELAKADRVQVQRKIAGAKGGFRSSMKRAKEQAFARPIAPPLAQAEEQASGERNSKPPDTQSHSKIISSSTRSRAREENNSDRPLATALPSGALAGGPTAEQDASEQGIRGKPPPAATRADLEAIYAARRKTA